MLRATIPRGSRKGTTGVLLLGFVALAAIVALHVTGAAAGLESGAAPVAPEATPCSDEILSVPALSTWAAVVMAILMLSASSFAMYGGNIAKRKNVTGTGSAAQPGHSNPVATTQVGDRSKRELSAKQREMQLRRERRRMSRMHSHTSRSKKRRAGPGCRGPLRKT